MALIHRLFQHSREKRFTTWGCGASKKDQNFESPESLTSYKCWQAPVLNEHQIRLLIFQECDVKGRKTLIDSKAIHKVDQQTTEAPAGSCRTPRYNKRVPSPDHKNIEKPRNQPNIVDGYRMTRPGSDLKMLGEMLFGSTPMSSKGPMIKVHTFKMPPKVMLSRIFLLKPPKEQLETDSCDKDTISLYCADIPIPRSISANSLPTVEIARSLPIAMPTSSPGRSFDESGEFSASGSFLSPFLPSSPGSSVSSSASNSSLHRRWLRNQVTSMEHGVRRRSSENINSTEEPIRRRKPYPKIGVAILFNLPEELSGKEDQEFRRFFFSHFTLLESHFQRLVTSIERALIFHRKAFTRPVMELLSDFKSTIIQLYTAPRIQRPIWLNLMTYPKQRGHLCEHLIRELGSLLESHNSKQNNFFMSRLLSSVLMHHLAWVPTVMPARSGPRRAFMDKHSSTTLDMLAKSHPYNPLWAQLGEMYGTIGLPNRVAKTIIVGKRADVVCRLLYVLSYFIRCSEVHEVFEKCENITVDYIAESELKDSDDTRDRRRTMTEELVLAKTEDSGIEDVGLTQSESSGKPMFYIQDKRTFDERSLPTETSSDDGVDLESESQDSDVLKQSQCIQGLIKCNQTNVKVLQTRTANGFDENDEVFRSDSESAVCQPSQEEVKVNSRTYPDDALETPVEIKHLNDRNDNNTDELVIMCKKLDTSMLTSKLEVATPVGRASRNIDDFLRFHLDDPVISKDGGDVTTCRTLQTKEKRMPSEGSARNSTLNKKCVDSSYETQTSCNSNQITISVERVSNTSQASAPNPSTSLTCCESLAAKQNCPPAMREPVKGSGHSNRTDLYHRSVSSMSAVSCASSTLSRMSDHACLDHEELPLASSEQMFEIEIEKTKSHLDNFGRSLLGGYSPHFVPDFALQGVPQLDLKRVEKSLQESAQHPVVDDAVLEAVYIVANTDSWTVDVVSCERFQGCGEKPLTQEVHISSIIDQLLDSVKLLHRMKLSSDFCLMHLEDRLQELYFRSTSVVGYLEHKPTVNARMLAGAVSVDCSDLPLLLAVAGVHSPHVIANVMLETIEQQRMSLQQESPPDL